MNNFEVYYDNPSTNLRERLVEGEIVESISIEMLCEKSGRRFIKQNMRKMWLNPWKPGKSQCP
jgi:hypothetical protein